MFLVKNVLPIKPIVCVSWVRVRIIAAEIVACFSILKEETKFYYVTRKENVKREIAKVFCPIFLWNKFL